MRQPTLSIESLTKEETNGWYPTPDRPPIIHKYKRRAKRALNKPIEADIVTAGPGISGKGSIEKKNNKEGRGEKTKESWCWHNSLCQ